MKHKTHQENCPFLRLSYDLLLDILFRLPANSLGRCALLSKSFNSLICDPKFAIAHLEFSNKTKPPSAIVLQWYNILSKLELEDYMDITKGVRLVGVQHQLPAEERYDYKLIGTCHGLVYIYLRSRLKSNVHLMFLWNPLTGKHREIVLPQRCQRRSSCDFTCWFGYLSSIDEYKIFLSCHEGGQILGCRLYLYSFRTSTWRDICVSEEVSRCFSRGLDVVFLSEALYCLCDRRWIYKFNLVEETFDKMPFSVGEPHVLKNCKNIILGVLGKPDCLSVVLMQYYYDEEEKKEYYFDEEEEEEEEHYFDEEEEENMTLELEVWLLKEYGNLNSWKKWRTIDLGGGFSRYSMTFVGFGCSGFLCFLRERGLIIIDPIYDQASYAIPYNVRCHHVINYVESLISPIDLR